MSKKSILFLALLMLATTALAACVPAPVITEAPSPEPKPTVDDQPQPPATGPSTLAGASWLLESLGPVDKPVDAVAGHPVTLEFNAEGGLSGNAGCNLYFASYQVAENRLAVGVVGSTERYCADPEGLADQEQQFLTALRAAERFAAEDDQLRIFYDGGAQVLRFRTASTATEDSSDDAGAADPLPALTAVVWVLDSSGPAGAEQAVPEGIQVDMVFASDGTISGNGGCNDYFASVQMGDGPAISFGPIGATKKLCPPPASEVEATYFEALGQVSQIRQDMAGIHLIYGEGKGLLHFRPGEQVG